MVAHWLVKSWAVLIAPDLTETDQAVYQSLNVMVAQEFSATRYLPGVRPRAVVQKLWDYCWRWLEPEKLTGAQMAETVVLEQFIQILPTGEKEWVK
uniref:SCAN box domain-containing protein n=1 Tax=Chrysemys picta bellii TaxID=8478 RepID=A0A8C3P7Y3_CHRPI